MTKSTTNETIAVSILILMVTLDVHKQPLMNGWVSGETDLNDSLSKEMVRKHSILTQEDIRTLRSRLDQALNFDFKANVVYRSPGLGQTLS